MLAFDLSFRYRNPVVVLCDGYLGQMTGKVTLPAHHGQAGHARSGRSAATGRTGGNLISSIQLSETDLEAHNRHLNAQVRGDGANEQRADLFRCDDAEVLFVACNTPARMAKGAVAELRQQGVKAGLFRPADPLAVPDRRPARRSCGAGRRIVVVEAEPGQLEDELRLALSHAGLRPCPRSSTVQRYGGVLPQQGEIVAQALAARRGAAGRGCVA